ncbi:hypothetical protein BS78_01G387500 [Paspalum vaginatum]|nr:hypothetical protein BS78_01G387500 [Paspalum vaginatum]
MQARTLDPFRSNCAEPDDNLHEPDPEPVKHDSFEKRETPDMFVTEKELLSSYEEKLISSGGVVDLEERVMASIVCSKAKEALDLASLVMDIASLRLGTIQFSQHTVDQMARTYASIFCNVAEDAVYKNFKTETILSFIGALRGLGAICHILVQDTVAKLKDGCSKNCITDHMGKYS